MKQHITPKQHDELSHKGAVRLGEWCVKRNYNPLLLSIGQMIEFLEDHHLEWAYLVAEGGNDGSVYRRYYRGELCDALWEAIKEVLHAD